MLGRPRDVEMQALLEPNSRQVASGHPYRGYTLVNSSKEIKDIKVTLVRVHMRQNSQVQGNFQTTIYYLCFNEYV